MGTPRNNIKGYYHRERNPVKIMGSFALSAAGTLDVDTIQGRGFTITVVPPAVDGRYSLAFDDAYSRLISSKVTMQCAADNVDMYAQAGTFTPGAAATVILRSMTGAVETDMPVNDRMNFEFTLYGEALDA